MKKILSLMLVVILAFGCVFALASCGEKSGSEITGVYELESIEGTMSYNGETVELDESLYEYYRITLEKDGTALIESKAAGSTGVRIEEEGTWEYEDGKLELKSSPQGITVVEEMEWDDGVITYTTEQYSGGISMSFTMVLKKVD